ncbi:MAG TPA: hypothetical protein VGM50_14100 [Gemmatimonadaceae bacterium]|jgi:hypothetical protein
MPLFARWRAERELQRKAAAYVATLFRDPDSADVAWLAQTATRGDTDHAQWELRYARRALGLLSAQRDALDDRTASSVAKEISQAFARDHHVAAGMVETVERQFNARLSAYRDGLAARAGAPTAVRMGQTLFAFAGGSFKVKDDNITRAGELLATYLAEANEALRSNFGAAALPENIAPSELGRAAGR